MPKLHVDGALFQVVRQYLNALWPPQRIANILRTMWPDDATKTVSHETIYNPIYLHPSGELKRELMACLHHQTQVRKPRSRGADRTTSKILSHLQAKLLIYLTQNKFAKMALNKTVLLYLLTNVKPLAR